MPVSHSFLGQNLLHFSSWSRGLDRKTKSTHQFYLIPTINKTRLYDISSDCSNHSSYDILLMEASALSTSSVVEDADCFA